MTATTWIAIVLGACNVLFLYLNGRQTRWKGAAEALGVENTTVRTRCGELEKANQVLIAQNADLKAKVDLTPIKLALDGLSSSITQQQESNQRAFNEVVSNLKQMQHAFQEYTTALREKHLV